MEFVKRVIYTITTFKYRYILRIRSAELGALFVSLFAFIDEVKGVCESLSQRGRRRKVEGLKEPKIRVNLTKEDMSDVRGLPDF